MRLLSVPDLDTGSILSFLAGRARDDVPSLDSWLESRLHDLLAEIDTLGPVGPVHPRTSTAQRIAAFRSWLESRPPAEAGAWPEVRPEGLPYLRDALSRLVFLRQTTLHPSLAWALVAYVAAARWASAWAANGDDSARPPPWAAASAAPTTDAATASARRGNASDCRRTGSCHGRRVGRRRVGRVGGSCRAAAPRG